jgi:hypothetical protein
LKTVVFALLFIFVTFNIFPLGRKEKMNTTQNLSAGNTETIDARNQIDESKKNITNIRGRVEIYGNEPRTFVGIVDENGIEYAVYPPSVGEELRKLQGYLIDFTVVLLDEPQGFSSLLLRGGTVTPIKWELR